MKPEIPLQEKYDSISSDMLIIAVKLRYLVSPLSAVRFYIDDILEDSEYTEHKGRLANIDKAAGRCLSIARDLIDLTMPYFDPESYK